MMGSLLFVMSPDISDITDMVKCPCQIQIRLELPGIPGDFSEPLAISPGE